MIPKSGHGFRKRSCSNNKVERDDDSKKSHPALGTRVTIVRPSDQSLQRLPRPGTELLGIQRIVAVPIGGFESLLDGCEILVLRQGAVMVPILGRQFLGTQPALQFASVERSIVVAIESIEQRRCRRLCFVEVD